jgi:hypothetical protein
MAFTVTAFIWPELDRYRAEFGGRLLRVVIPPYSIPNPLPLQAPPLFARIV